MNYIVPMAMEVHKFPRISYKINLTKKCVIKYLKSIFKRYNFIYDTISQKLQGTFFFDFH